MTDVAIKSPARIAHEQRNAEAKAQAGAAKAIRIKRHEGRNLTASIDAIMRRNVLKADRIDAHRRRNFKVSVDALERRDARVAAHEARNEAVALEAATRAYAEAVEATCGIPVACSMPANDNAAAVRAA